MAKLLYVEASPRKERGVSIEVAKQFLDVYRASHPADLIEKVDVWSIELPELDPDVVATRGAAFLGKALPAEQQATWTHVRATFDHFASADKYLFAVPMWNFGIPYRLKHYIDVVTQPQMAFSYSARDGYAGLLHGKAAMLITSRFGSYHWGSGLETYDYQRTYIETWLRFIGITRVRCIVVDPNLVDPHTENRGKAVALAQARETAIRF